MKLKRIVSGYPIRAEIKKLDEGWDIGIFGGCKTHVGAVTLAEPDGTVHMLERPCHRDGFVSGHWASELAQMLKAPICVRCGIHYDNATKEQLAEITAGCDEILRELMASLEEERKRQ